VSDKAIEQNGHVDFKPFVPKQNKTISMIKILLILFSPYGTLIFDQYNAVDCEVICPHG
jgi:hypothetical protein